MANQTCLLHVVMIITALFLYSAPNVHGWGIEGHTITCRIAQVLDLFIVFIFRLNIKILTNK